MKQLIIIGCFCLIAAHRAHAEFVVYGDDTRDQWFEDATNAGGVTTIGFDAFGTATPVSDQYSEFGITFSGINSTVGPSGTFPDSWGIQMIDGNHLYFETPIQWIAGDFRAGLRFDIYVDDTFLHRFERPLPERFLGGYSTVPFNHIFVYDPGDFLTVIDDLHFGPPIAIPAPGAMVVTMMMTMVPGVRSPRRRRSR